MYNHTVTVIARLAGNDAGHSVFTNPKSLVDFVNIKDDEELTPMQHCIQGLSKSASSVAEIAKLLIEAGADVSVRYKNGNTLLHDCSDAVVAKLLIDAGVDVNAKDGCGMTPLFRCSNAAVAKLLIDAGADVNAKNRVGETPLFRCGDTSVAKVLIEAGANVNAKDTDGNTPLMSVICFDSTAILVDLVKLLVDAGADVNAKNKYGQTSLFCFYGRNDAEAAKVLIKAGADVNAKNKDGETPLQKCGDTSVMKVLIEACADARTIDKKGNTLLHRRTYNPDITKLLIDAGLDVNAKNTNNKGRTPLFYIADHASGDDNGFVDSAKLLIEAGADVNAIDSDGKTPLLVCVDTNLAKLFLEAGADVNAKDNKGNTRLHAVIPCDDDCIDRNEDNIDNAYYHFDAYIHLMKFLIESGADVNAKNNDGKTPLDVCMRYRIEKILIEAGAHHSSALGKTKA